MVGSRELQQYQNLESACRAAGGGADENFNRDLAKLKTNSKELKSNRFIKGSNVQRSVEPDEEGLWPIILHPINVLLVFIPVAVCSHIYDWGALLIFWSSFAAMVPLAKMLGDATEELAASLKNDMVAGLLNATFGNAVEVVIMVQTLRAGMFRIVKSSLLGSVLSNTLLVLGMSFLCGGLFTMKDKEEYKPLEPSNSDGKISAGRIKRSNSQFQLQEKIQSFSLLGALVNTSMLLVSCMTFSLVTIFHAVLQQYHKNYPPNVEEILLPVSRVSSIIIMMAYIAYIFFQLVTHRAAMAEDADDEENEEGNLTTCVSMTLLFTTTIFTAWMSEILVSAIDRVVQGAHISEHFIGIVLLPIVGNACEHAAAVRFAVQDKLGLSVGIAVGSSTQIALFVVPLSVICGWIIDQPMDLNFGILNSSLITLSVVVVLSMVVDGQSNWLQGYLLCSVYAIIATMYWNLPNFGDDNFESD